MDLPYMLVMRNQPNGLVWQAYRVETEQEARLIRAGGERNYFRVEVEPVGYIDETCPGWRDTPEWRACLTNDNPPK